MIQKLIALGLSAAMFAVATPAFAVTAQTPDPTINCVKAAVATREAALMTASDAQATAIHSARVARAAALADAYSKTTVNEVKAGIQAAWDAWTGARGTALRTWRTARNSLWKTFKTSRKACHAPAATVPSEPGSPGKEG